jgi:glycosyltransferase involved in cell wall biosynthesis
MRRHDDGVTTRAQILEVTSYPPPRAGWGIRVEFLKKRLEREGHQCVVLNTGPSRMIPSDEYETVLGVGDLVRKLWRFSRRGFVVHAHANGDSLKGVVLATVAEAINLACGRRCYLTFHAGVVQRYFPLRERRWPAPLFWLLFAIPRRIICNSDAVKAKIQEYGVPAGKIAAIPAFSTQYLEFEAGPLPPPVHAFFGRYRHVILTYARMRSLFYPETLIEGFARLRRRREDTGLLLCGVSGHPDPGVWEDTQDRIRRHGVGDHICIVEDLERSAFLNALQQSAVYLRTPITDGVSSSVLESMALRVPVLACENGTRPQGVLTYKADDPEEMAARLEYILANHEHVVASLGSLNVKDTLAEEIALLTAPLAT